MAANASTQLGHPAHHTVPEVLRLGTDTLHPAAVARAVRGGAGAGRAGGAAPRVELAAEALARIDGAVALRDRLIASGMPIYGVTTGFGDSNTGHILPARAAALQQNLVVYHLNGSGPSAAPDVVRATMLVRANCLARGYSGIRREVIQLLLDCLAADLLPVIPERGSVGASGDLVPLCYLANLLLGNGEVDAGGQRMPAAAALAAHGLAPVALEPKEALALINGTSFMSAFAILALSDATELAFAADVCTALASEALRGNRGHFDAVIHAQKPHPGQVASAARIRGLLAGSRLTRSHTQLLRENQALDGQAYQRLDHPIQDRYSIRCAPHVTGVLHDTLDWVDRWVSIECNSTNDNPLFDVDTQAVYNGGNFYGGHIGQAMDALKVAVAGVGDLLDRQLALVVDEKFNHGLPANLTPRLDPDDPEIGLHHGFKGMQIACSAQAAEALKASAPATVFSRSTEAHNQDKVSMGTIAARDARTVVDLVATVAAIHLSALCQAADLRGADLLGAGTRAAYEAVRARVPFIDDDRRMDGDIAQLADLVRCGALREAVTAAVGDCARAPQAAYPTALS